MRQMGQSVEDLSGFTCCPERTLLKSLGSDVWELTAVRNLANAERAEHTANRGEIIAAKAELTAEPADNYQQGHGSVLFGCCEGAAARARYGSG